jgi:hypothetical protein
MLNKTNIRIYGLLFLILVIGIVIRLIHITSPLLDFSYHRQIDTASIARNFYLHGYQILYPEIDFTGNDPGYIESEFPLFPFLVALIYRVTGVEEWVGRLLAVIFWMGSFIYLTLLVRRFWDSTTALFCSFIYAISPLGVYYARTFMPESTMIFFSVGLIYYFTKWIDTDCGLDLWFAIIFAAFAFLVKISTLYLLIPVTFLGWLGDKRYRLGLFLSLALLPAILWYFHAHQLYLKYHNTFGIWQFRGDKWGSLGLWLSGDFYRTMFYRVTNLVLTPPGLPLFIFGILLKVKTSREYLFHVWTGAIIFYFLVVGQGNVIHEHYQLPLVPLAAIFVGKGLAKINTYRDMKESLFDPLLLRVATAVYLGFMVLFCYKRLLPHYSVDSRVMEIVASLKKLSSEKDLIITNGDNEASIQYYAQRKGWSTNEIKPEKILSLMQKGARYLVLSPKEVLGLKRDFARIVLPYGKFILEGENYIIFELIKGSYTFILPKAYHYSQPPDYPGWTDTSPPQKLMDGYDGGGAGGSVAWRDFTQGTDILITLPQPTFIHGLILRIFYHSDQYRFPETEIFFADNNEEYQLVGKLPALPFMVYGPYLVYSDKIDRVSDKIRISLAPLRDTSVALTEINIYGKIVQ